MWHDITHLRAKGYKVQEKSPWHFQVAGAVLINIWPTKRKWMVQYDSGASFYQDAGDLLRIVQKIIGEPGAKKIRNPRWLVDQLIAQMEAKRTDADREAEVIWREGVAKLSTYLTCDGMALPVE